MFVSRFTSVCYAEEMDVSFLLVQGFFLLIVIILLYLLTWFLPTDSPWSPWWTTSAAKSREICKLARITAKDVFYELGSGTGTTLGVVAKECQATVVGIESDVSRVWWSKLKLLRIQRLKNITILQKSFFSASLSPATVVYLYLVPRVIEKLQPKLFAELQPGTRIVSYVYPLPYLKLEKDNKKEQLFLYVMPKKKLSAHA